jgi:N-hydroxyarylamine O-acetyltransferase
VNVDRYLSRLGLDPADVRARPRDRETLERLQRAHVTSVPFETLSIADGPAGSRDDRPGPEPTGVSLAVDDLYRKVVERRRGGFCFELNGLFGRLLDEFGFDVDTVAAMVVTDGDPSPPANHRSHVVHLDRRYVVDVGMGVPTLRRPLPLDGTAHVDDAGVGWRVADSDRPDVDCVVQYDGRETDGWADRYLFGTTPRERSYFEATCDYLATAPESPFTGTPVVSMASGRRRGHDDRRDGAGGADRATPRRLDR